MDKDPDKDKESTPLLADKQSTPWLEVSDSKYKRTKLTVFFKDGWPVLHARKKINKKIYKLPAQTRKSQFQVQQKSR